MGTPDYYGNVQLKVGPNICKQYHIGDKVDIPDGIYIGWEGAVVIKDSIFIASFENSYEEYENEDGIHTNLYSPASIYTKWGTFIPVEEILK